MSTISPFLMMTINKKNLDNKLSLPLNIIMQYIGDFGHF